MKPKLGFPNSPNKNNMYSCKYLLVSLLSILFLSVNAQDNPVRQRQSFNYNWKFSLGDSIAYSSSTYNDSTWRELSLPHDWSIEADFSKKLSGRNAWLPGGIGWYRKQFSLLPEEEGRHFELQFDGIYRHAKIWINDIYVGVQYDGYTSFYYDITDYLHFDKPNTIAVRVDNSDQPNARWYTGSGIYQNVWLNKVNPLHIKHWGTYITTPTVNNQEAEVDITTVIENMGESKKIVLETTIYTPEGTKVGFRKTKPFEIGQFESVEKFSAIVIRNPFPWSLETPNIYTAVTQIKEGNTIIDDYTSEFGVRTIRFDADKGFLLNEQNIKLKGVCVHMDGGPLGVVVPKAVWRRRLENLKEIGCNAIRTAHNPATPEFLDLCDELGFLVMNEFVDKWDDEKWANPFFEMEWKKNFASTIARDHNHPSVIIWSVGNENYSPEDIRQTIGLKKYCNYVRSLDPSRPVVSGMERGKDTDVAAKVDAIIESCKYMDLIALNYGEQWCSEIGERKPGKAYISTESYTYFTSDPEKRFANNERSPWFDVLENDFNAGLFLWVGIDYLGESKKFPKIGSDSGLLDIGGNIKERGRFYQSLWTEEPMVEIFVYDDDPDDFSNSGRWGWPSMSQAWNFLKGDQLNLVTYTNCDEIDLYVNRRKVGTQQMADSLNHIMKWKDVIYKPGVVKAIGKIKGEEVCEFEIHTAGIAEKVNVKADNEMPESWDIVHVEVEVVDQDNFVLPIYSDVLRFEIEGDAKILGVTNGNMNRAPIYPDKTKSFAHNGKCLLILKMGKEPSDVKLTVSAVGLEPGIIEINKTVVEEIEE